MRRSPSRAKAETLVFDSGPLIALARGGALDAIGDLPYVFLTPPEVRSELVAGSAAGHPPIEPSWLRTRPLRRPLEVLDLLNLGRGEAAVIRLATELDGAVAVLDEVKARRVASAVGVRLVGTLGLLARAKVLGRVTEVRPIVERMTAAGDWYATDLVERVLRDIGE